MLLHLHMIHLNTQLLHAPQQHNIQDSGTNTHQCEDKNEAKNMENSDLLPPSLALTLAIIIIVIVPGGSFICIAVTSWQILYGHLLILSRFLRSLILSTFLVFNLALPWTFLGAPHAATAAT